VTAAGMTETALPLRPGGLPGETLEQAMAAIGEGFTSFDAEALRMSAAAPEAEADSGDLMAIAAAETALPQDLAQLAGVDLDVEFADDDNEPLQPA